MHTVLLAADAAVAEELAAAWRAGGSGSADTATLPSLPGGPAPAGVFVPLGSLGLRSVAGQAGGPAEARLRELVAGADLVVVHLEVLDGAALHDGALPVVARAAGDRALPLVVLAGRSEVTRREWSAGGVSSVHEIGPGDGTTARDAAVRRAARTWAPPWDQAVRTP